MKRFGAILVILLLSFGTQAFAETSVLIDFSQLVADYEGTENEATLVDFSAEAGTGFTAEERQAMKTSLYIENWEVDLNSSAQSALTNTNSRISLNG